MITKRDKEVLEFIKNYMMKNGMTPTIREIGDGIGLSGTSTVHRHFRNLVDAGLITQIPNEKSYRYAVKGMKYVCEDG